MFEFNIVQIFLKIDRSLSILYSIYLIWADSLACLPYYEYEFIIYHIMTLEILEQLSPAK